MFDDQNASAGSPPPNLPFQPPEDMLAGIENDSQVNPSASPDALSAGLLKPKSSSSIPPTPPPVSTLPLSYATKPPILGKVLGAAVGIVALGAVGFGGWYLYSRVLKGSPESSVKDESTTTLPVVTIPTATPEVTLPIASSTTPVLTGDMTDTDHDGLTDEEEKKYGTDLTKTDTDNDGLSDFDEIKVWSTNPTNPDTDGDSYKDSDEVKNGYNPHGPGKLFPPPTSATTTVAPSPSIPALPSTSSTSSTFSPTNPSTSATSVPRI